MFLKEPTLYFSNLAFATLAFKALHFHQSNWFCNFGTIFHVDRSIWTYRLLIVSYNICKCCSKTSSLWSCFAMVIPFRCLKVKTSSINLLNLSKSLSLFAFSIFKHSSKSQQMKWYSKEEGLVCHQNEWTICPKCRSHILDGTIEKSLNQLWQDGSHVHYGDKKQRGGELGGENTLWGATLGTNFTTCI